LKVWSWLQLTLHIGLLLHFFSVLLEYQMPYLLLYASFFWVSVYAYTSLMDGTWDALGAELLKAILVFVTFTLLGSWFASPEGIQLNGFIIGYTLLSLAISIYTLLLRKPVQVNLLAKA
jgi:alkylglycerol monooxygenase